MYAQFYSLNDISWKKKLIWIILDPAQQKAQNDNYLIPSKKASM